MTRRCKKSRKKEVWIRDKYLCGYCGVKLTEENRTVEHKIPLQYGGTHALDNLMACCRPCNLERGKKSEIRIYRHD